MSYHYDCGRMQSHNNDHNSNNDTITMAITITCLAGDGKRAEINNLEDHILPRCSASLNLSCSPSRFFSSSSFVYRLPDLHLLFLHIILLSLLLPHPPSPSPPPPPPPPPRLLLLPLLLLLPFLLLLRLLLTSSSSSSSS